MNRAKHNTYRCFVCICFWKEWHLTSYCKAPSYTAAQKTYSYRIGRNLADFTGLLTFSLWDKTWSKSCHPRHSTDLGLGSSQHRQSHRCGSGARIPGWPLHLSSHTAVAVEGNGKIYFRCGRASPKTQLAYQKVFELILE